MMKPHTIDLSALQEWRESEEVVFASSTREKKRLLCNLHGGMKVTVAGVTIWQGMQAYSAVEAYNSITEKYVDKSSDFVL